MIYQVTTFKDEKGHQIDAYSEHGKGVFSTFCKFVGHAVGLFDTPQGKQPLPYMFTIDAATVEEAFEKYSEAAKTGGQAHQQRIEDQVRRNRLAGH